MSARIGRSTGHGFDRLAPWYQTLEKIRFGSRLHRARTALLHRLPPSKRVLVLGDGDGRLLSEFVERSPSSDIVSIDFSQEMLRRQQRTLSIHGASEHAGPGSITWICADSRKLPEMGSFDLIITAFHLDCFEGPELDSVINSILERLNIGGHWYVVDFVIPPRGFFRYWAKAWVHLMIRFFRWTTGMEASRLPDLRSIFKDHPLELTHEVIGHHWLGSFLWRKAAVDALHESHQVSHVA